MKDSLLKAFSPTKWVFLERIITSNDLGDH